MTRAKAIALIIGTWKQNDGEFCVGDIERLESNLEMREALRTLGVTESEMGRTA